MLTRSYSLCPMQAWLQSTGGSVVAGSSVVTGGSVVSVSAVSVVCGSVVGSGGLESSSR